MATKSNYRKINWPEVVTSSKSGPKLYKLKNGFADGSSGAWNWRSDNVCKTVVEYHGITWLLSNYNHCKADRILSMASVTISVVRDDESYQSWLTDVYDPVVPESGDLIMFVRPLMSTEAVHGRSEPDLPFTTRRPKDPGEPTTEIQQPRGLSAERNKNYSSSVQISSDNVNRGSIGRG